MFADVAKSCYEEHQLKHHTSDDRFDYSSGVIRNRAYNVSSSPPPYQAAFRPVASREDDNLHPGYLSSPGNSRQLSGSTSCLSGQLFDIYVTSRATYVFQR